MNKILNYSIGIIALVLVLFFSLNIQDLDEFKKATKKTEFNADNYAMDFWSVSLPQCIENATKLDSLLPLLKENRERVFEEYGNKLGISKTYYFFVKSRGVIEKVDTDYILLTLEGQKRIKIATDFIFGNAVRDGSGKVNINEFLNMTDFNNVSVAINKLVKEKVAVGLRNSAIVGKTLEFTGATEISLENIDLSNILIIPVSVKVSDE